MPWTRLIASLKPTFHDHSEVELFIASDGAASAQFTLLNEQHSAQVPREKIASLLSTARERLMKAKTEKLQGARDGIHGTLTFECEAQERIEVEYWSPIPSDASYKLVAEIIDLVSPLFPSPVVSAHFLAIRAYLR
jgi:hypothetical protein